MKTTENETPEPENPHSLSSAKITRDVRWTEIGLILLIVNGILIIFIASFQLFYRSFNYLGVFGNLGLVLFGSGGALILFARKAFGPRHSAFVILSLSIIVIMNLLFLTGGLTFVFSLIMPPGASIIVVLAALDNIPGVLLTYEIQDSRGRIVLLVGYTVGLAWSATLAYQSLTGPLGVLAGPISIPLTLAPVGIFTLAFYLAYFRLRKGGTPQQNPATLLSQ